MERMLVVIFDSEEQAYEASRALDSLNELSVIGLYADALVTKQPDGAIKVTECNHGDPQGTMGATAVGTMIGMLGGPVGLAVGAATGLVVGATADFARTRIDKDFVEEVATELGPGKTAVVAEINEGDTDSVDERMMALGGFVFRRALSDVADTEYEREVAAIKADLARMRAEHAASRGARRAKLQASIDSLKGKLHHARRR